METYATTSDGYYADPQDESAEEYYDLYSDLDMLAVDISEMARSCRVLRERRAGQASSLRQDEGRAPRRRSQHIELIVYTLDSAQPPVQGFSGHHARAEAAASWSTSCSSRYALPA